MAGGTRIARTITATVVKLLKCKGSVNSGLPDPPLKDVGLYLERIDIEEESRGRKSSQDTRYQDVDRKKERGDGGRRRKTAFSHSVYRYTREV